MTLEAFTYTGTQPGPKLLVLGAIHGDEHCGPEGIQKAMEQLQNGALSLHHGSVTFVPVCNPLAHSQNERQINANLNRVILRHEKPVLPEHELANQICDLIDAHDILLDLHSYAAGEKPFLFLDRDDDAHRAFASALPFDYWVTGWPALYAENPDLNAGDTVQYAHTKDKTAILVECGHHTNPQGGALAFETILAAMQHFGLVEKIEIPSTAPYILTMKQIVVKPDQGYSFNREWQHLDALSKGDVITLDMQGKPSFVAPFDGYMVMPHASAKTNEEWFYLAF